ncbi:hypothetical protein [Stella sp.]|uniref:hypothetical protein n=1 Tax=Stella sp. TaxID=2912054 RepID=UPI0035AE133A
MRQPWLDGGEPAPGAPPDLFTRKTAVVPARRAGAALALAVLVLVAGTTAEQARAVLDLPLWPGTDQLIGLVDALDGAARAVGLDQPHAALRALARRLEGAGDY